MGGKERNNDSFRTQLNRKIKTGLQTKFTYVLRTKVFWTQNVLPFFPLCRCVRVYQCTDVRAILSRYWLALESEFCIKKNEEMFRHWQRTLKQTAHYSTMPKLFTRPGSTWPSHDNVQTQREWMSISLAGNIRRRSEFMGGGGGGSMRARQPSK